jgi:hypothetical protein
VARAVKPGKRQKQHLSATASYRKRAKQQAEARKAIFVKNCARCGQDHPWERCPAKP